MTEISICVPVLSIFMLLDGLIYCYLPLKVERKMPMLNFLEGGSLSLLVVTIIFFCWSEEFVNLVKSYLAVYSILYFSLYFALSVATVRKVVSQIEAEKKKERSETIDYILTPFKAEFPGSDHAMLDKLIADREAEFDNLMNRDSFGYE